MSLHFVGLHVMRLKCNPTKCKERPFGYLLIDLKTSTQDNCRLGTNVLPREEGFNQAGFQENIPQELLKYLKQQTLSPVPLLPAMQEIHGNVDDVLSRNDLRDYEQAKLLKNN